MAEPNEERWLLLIHQIPPKPDYLRVKIWRRLQRLGAVPVKNSVYVLPKSDQSQEDFQWVLREVVESGGDASLCEARFVDGLSDDEVMQLFRSAREEDYQEISRDLERIAISLSKKKKTNSENRKQLALELERIHKRMAEVVAIDFFGASGRESAERVIFALDARLHQGLRAGRGAAPPRPALLPQQLRRRQHAHQPRGRGRPHPAPGRAVRL